MQNNRSSTRCRARVQSPTGGSTHTSIPSSRVRVREHASTLQTCKPRCSLRRGVSTATAMGLRARAHTSFDASRSVPSGSSTRSAAPSHGVCAPGTAHGDPASARRENERPPRQQRKRGRAHMRGTLGPSRADKTCDPRLGELPETVRPDSGAGTAVANAGLRCSKLIQIEQVLKYSDAYLPELMHCLQYSTILQ